MRRKKKEQIVYSLFNLHRPLLSTTLGSFWIPSLDRRSSLTSYKNQGYLSNHFSVQDDQWYSEEAGWTFINQNQFHFEKEWKWLKVFFYEYHSYMYLINTELQVLFVWCLCIYVYVICQILIFLSLSSLSLLSLSLSLSLSTFDYPYNETN